MLITESNESDDHARRKRYLIEPIGTQMGMIATISVPLEYAKTVSVAYFFEGNYYTLQNVSWLRPAFETDVIEEGRNERSLEDSLEFKSLSRKFTYVVLEKNIENQGLPGRACLLRAICEHAESPVHHNGIVGDLLFIVFTPSSSRDEDLPDSFYEAEENGKYGECIKYRQQCPASIINSISFVRDNL